MTLPPPADIAHTDARRLARVLREVGGEGAPLGSGWMACDVPGSWAHYAAGVGEDGPVKDAIFDDLAAFYALHAATPRILTTPYQHPSLFAGLAVRGYVVEELDVVLVRPLTGLVPVESDVRFIPVERGDPASVDTFVRVHLGGFFDEDPPAGMRAIMARVAADERCHLFLAELDGEIVGSGGVETFEGSAVLIAGGVLPTARRRGVQGALIAHRLAEATRRGCTYALVGSAPGGPTERNALRAGFRPAFTSVQFRGPTA
jgi:GNAT superfamily N-acetyltransferase